jgi:integrase
MYCKAQLLDAKRHEDTAVEPRVFKRVHRKCWTLLRSILEDAIDDEVIVRHPKRKLPLPKTRIPNKPTLDPQLIAKVLRAVNNNAFISALLHVGVFCAVRTSEVLGLRWRSFCGDHFLIRDSAWKGKLLEDATKTGERRVAIPPASRKALLRWREQCKDVRPDALIFPSKRGTPISAHNLHNRVLKPLRDKLGLSAPLTFQVLRRSHATRNQRRPKDAQTHLGHKSIVTTMNIYAQEIPASVRQMVAKDEAAVLRLRAPRPSAKKKANHVQKSEVAPKLLPSRSPRGQDKLNVINNMGA